ncbi:MAG: hypothetical protein H0T20_08505 [Actinobacteria bacterium]|nr:hypothetical protein [Actinomycetota bacterium]
MRSERANTGGSERAGTREVIQGLPKPTTAFRRRAWLQFQRALDPLSPPKPFRIERR